MPSGIGQRKKFVKFYPKLYQNHNESTRIYFHVDQSFQDNDDGIIVEAEGNIPYWSDNLTADRRQSWGSTVWADAPMLPFKGGISIRRKGSFLESIIDNLGENAYDEMAYGGGEISYQLREMV